MSRKSLETFVVYASAVLQGICMVSFPASSGVLKEMKGFTDAEYGSIFVPLVVTTIVGSLIGGGLSRRVRLKWLLVGALCFSTACQATLGAVAFTDGTAALRLLLVATALFGLGFGLAAGPLNAFPALLFPARKDSALLALHTIIGAGLSLGPLAVGFAIAQGAWPFFPWGLAAFAALLLVLAVVLPLHFDWPATTRNVGVADEDPLRTGALWTCLVLAILYALAEGTFGNWCVIFLTEDRGVTMESATMALSVFWAMLAVGRLVTSVILLRFSTVRVWLTLPLLMAAAFLLLPHVRSAGMGVVAFGFAGLACSAFFPLTVGLISSRFPARTALVSSVMTAGLMIGVGSGAIVVGEFRAALSIERLYQLSTLYPALAFVIALVLARSGHLKAAQ